MIDRKLVEKFMHFFSGSTTVIGRYSPPNTDTEKGKKEEGRSWHDTNALKITYEDYENHLNKKMGLGICPETSENKVCFAVIDIDIYNLSYNKYQNIINNYELPFVLFKSKSGGLHCYVFLKNFIQAKNIRGILENYRAIFGLKKGTEIFPKSVDSATKKGFFINLPYFGDTRKALNSKSNEIELDEALQLIENNLTTFENLKQKLENLPLFDAPVCLQSLYIENNISSNRELYLFNLAIYFKAKYPDSWQAYVEDTNKLLGEPLDYKEVQNQVIASNEKHTYSYKCKDIPLCDRCDLIICRERKLGKNGDELSQLSFEQLSQIKTDPPKYNWIINGCTMTFYTESDLYNQDEFIYQCMRYLHIVTNRIKKEKWLAILAKHFAELEVVEVDINERVDPLSILASYVFEYITSTVRALNKEQFFSMHRVFFNEENKFYYFKKDRLIDFITNKRSYKHYNTVQLGDSLTKLGVESKNIKLYINKDAQAIRACRISEESICKLGEIRVGLKEDLADFSEYDPNNRY